MFYIIKTVRQRKAKITVEKKQRVEELLFGKKSFVTSALDFEFFSFPKHVRIAHGGQMHVDAADIQSDER